MKLRKVQITTMPVEFSFDGFSPDGRAMVCHNLIAPSPTRGFLDAVQIREVPSGVLRVEIPNQGRAANTWYSSDGRTLAVEWITETNRWIERLPRELQSLAVRNLDLTPRLTNEIIFYGMLTGRPLSRLAALQDWNVNVAFSPDGKILATWTVGGALTLWDAPR